MEYPASAVQSGEGEGKTSKPSFLNPMVAVGSSPPIILGGKEIEEKWYSEQNWYQLEAHSLVK